MSQDASTAVSEPVVTQDATPTDSAPVETNVPEVAAPDAFEQALDGQDAPAEAETEADTTQDEPTGDDEQAADETNTEEQPLSKAEQRKQQLNTEIRDLVAERNRIRTEVEQLNTQVYQPQSAEDLMGQINPETGQPFNPLEARVAAMEQQQQLERYNTQVAEAQLTLEHESAKVMEDFPIFNPDSADFKQEVADQAAQLLQANLILDPNTGQVIGSHVSPYQLYATIAGAAKTSEVQGQLQGQKATEQMLANADTPSTAAPAKKKSDPFLDGFDADY